MNTKQAAAALFSALLMAGSAWSLAADKPEAAKPGMSVHGGQGMSGMQGKEGMGGMMGMMGSCERMMQGGSMAHGMPQLPPGNAKLQLQMQAEIMQKTGEIMAKYAAQVREEGK